MDLSEMHKIIARAAENNDIVRENPDETNPLFRERAKEYLKALKEITGKNEYEKEKKP